MPPTAVQTTGTPHARASSVVIRPFIERTLCDNIGGAIIIRQFSHRMRGRPAQDPSLRIGEREILGDLQEFLVAASQIQNDRIQASTPGQRGSFENCFRIFLVAHPAATQDQKLIGRQVETARNWARPDSVAGL